MNVLLAVRLIIFFSILFVSKTTASCFSSNTTYALCSSNGTKLSLASELFNEVELAKECREHFAIKLLKKSCDNHSHDHHHPQTEVSPIVHKPPTTAERYIYGLIAVFTVSALSLIGLLALPILYKVSFEYVLNFFTAVAVGTLFGDAMFHLIPTFLGLHNHNLTDHHHDHSLFSTTNHQWKLLVAVFVLYTFYLLEVFLHWFAHYQLDHNAGHSHIHNHSHKNTEIFRYTRVDADLEHSHRQHNHTHHNLHQHFSTPSMYSNAKSHINNTSSPCIPCVCTNEMHVSMNSFVEHDSKDRAIDDKSEQASIAETYFGSQLSHQMDNINPIVRQLKTIKSTGWMVLFGDGIHNFADGMAIGAAFSKSIMFGIATTITVACHELPHELGDYAILLQSGFSHCRALLWNFLSATTAIIGFFISSRVSVDESTRQWIFAATFGMFLYIALVDLLPTLLADGKTKLKHFIVVNIGFLLGLTLMFLLAVFEDDIQSLLIK